LLKSLVTIMEIQAEAKGIVLEADLTGLPTALEGDAARLNQILTNLLSNAIKFTERGSVTLIARQVAVTAAGVALRFTVRDTGIGIPLEAQPRLFTPFIQADESITRRYGGTGLGLSIINSLTQLMGGTVNFTSAPGVGSEFWVDLEFALAVSDSAAIELPAPVANGGLPLNDLRVLVVDDYDVNLQVTKLILEQHGARVRLAANGIEAVAQLQAEPAAIDVVLMDVQMPVLDGYEATRRIRTDLGLADLPIIALTAGALSSERQRAVEVGMNDFIIKPFDAPALIAVVERHSRRTRGLAAAPADPDSRPVPTADPWREIDGIDMDDARGRWCDDWDLFRSMLERLLSEFADIATAACWEVPGAAATQAARLHKLKGGASMLGAKALRELGTAAEAACIAGDVAQADKLSQGVATALQRLRVSALMAYEAARGNAPGPDASDNAPLERTALADLVAQLRQMRTSALTDFKGLSPLLRRLLGAESFALLRTRMEALEFDEVADALDALAAA
jgi:CheY-like chemotaxis protein